jgi:anti-sigma B factor antagonist
MRSPSGVNNSAGAVPGGAQPFSLRRRSEDGRTVLELVGDCDISTLGALNDALRRAIDERPNELVVDLARTTFVDSLTLGSLTAAAKSVRAAGRTFDVVGASAPGVRRAFELTGLDGYLLRP